MTARYAAHRSTGSTGAVRPGGEPFSDANYVKGNWGELKAHLQDQSSYREEIGDDPFAGVSLPR